MKNPFQRYSNVRYFLIDLNEGIYLYRSTDAKKDARFLMKENRESAPTKRTLFV
jgi:hypothetical protein